MSSKNGKSLEPIPQVILEALDKESLIKLVRVLEQFHDKRAFWGKVAAASFACTALPFLFLKFGAVAYAVAPFLGVFVLYVLDETVKYFINRSNSNDKSNPSSTDQQPPTEV